ncbi:MAG: methylamine utilization protein MauJ [Terriglobales bacterium]
MPVSRKPWGVPGEEHQLWVVPLKAGQKPPERLTGAPGKYKVQFLLSRPGYPLTAEREHKFIDEIIGDSHLAITKPLKVRKPEDAVVVVMQATGHGQQIAFKGLPNDNGYLGKLVAEEFYASSFQDAETLAYQVISPFLSAWSLHLDIPVHVETIQVTDLQTHISSLRVRTPPFEMTFAGGVTPMLTDDFCQYASLYREGMNSNSGFYRFLCFYKIIESIPHRRSRTNEAAKQAGQQVRRFREIVPSTTNEILALLKEVYPWRAQWDALALDQIVPADVRGQKIGWVREKHLNPLRVGIAHALLKTGEIRITLDKLEHIQQVNKWLPLCRVLARMMLRNEFPTEFGLAMKPLIFGQ